MKLEWMDPPESHSGRKSKVAQMVAALQKNPGVWARVDKGMKSTAASVKWKKAGCESVARASTDDSRLWDIFARWPEGPGKSGGTAGARKPPALVLPVSRPHPGEVGTAAPTSASEPADVAVKTGLDPDDPQDQYLARQRAKLEADRAARLSRASRAAANGARA